MEPSPLRVAMLLLAMILSISAPVHSAESPTKPSGWTLTLEWSPEYCHRQRGSKERQCEEEHYFIVSRLRAQFSGTAPACSSEPLPANLLDQAYMDIPNRELVRQMWAVDGRCSGLTAPEYVVQLGRAGRLLTMPAELKAVRGRLSSGREQLAGLLAGSNPALPVDGIVPQCEGRYLSELRICLTSQFEFARCSVAIESQCPDTFVLRGTPEGRLRKPR